MGATAATGNLSLENEYSWNKEYSTADNPINGLGDDLIQVITRTGPKLNVPKAKQLQVFDTVPDCSKWTCEQVFGYFHVFFPDKAHVFKEQNIDGAALLLMNRSDLFNSKFNLSVGTILKMYRHVVSFQLRFYDSPNN